MQITLFEAAQQVRAQLEQIDPETGEISEAWLHTRELFQQKGKGCVAWLKEKKAATKAARAFVDALYEKVCREEKHAERLERYLAENMRASGIHEIKDELGLFGAKLYIGRDEVVQIEEGAQFPPELCNDPKPPAPSKTKIKAAIKAGQAIKGARLVRKDRLAIT